MSKMAPDFEPLLDQLRQLEVNPHKLAAISAILLSESKDGKDENSTEISRLDRAFGWICAAIDEVDPAVGVRIKVALNHVRETLDGLGIDVEDQVVVNGVVVSKEAWDDPETYNRAMGSSTE